MNDKELFLKKFEDKLKKRLDKNTLEKLSGSASLDEDITSTDYDTFRKETLPDSFSLYERACNFSEKILAVKADKNQKEKIEQAIYSAHINCTSTGVTSLTILSSLTLLFLAMTVLFFNTIIGAGLLIIAVGVYFGFQNLPYLLAKRSRAKASDQVIIAIFYIVAFMRFTSNFELAVAFAANYLNPPLSLDFKRILWDLENAKYPNIKAAFDVYLEGWRDENLEFLEAIYLIESSLYEGEDFRRISLLDKALDIILQGNYEKMVHFAQELREKVNVFNMIGIVLPILGLIILPLAASFGNPKTIWDTVFLLYNIIFPALVAYFGFTILFNRPTSVNSIKTPNLKNFKKLQQVPIKISKTKTLYITPKVYGLCIFIILLFIGMLPVIFHNTGIDETLNTQLALIFPDSPFGTFSEYKFIDKNGGYEYGPYGTYPGILSLFIPLSFAFGLGYYLRFKYKNLIGIRDKTRKLEEQFPSAAFQLGNRINEGISAELAFGAVSETMKGTEAGTFFSKIDENIKFNGMSIEKSIFDPEKGAIVQYPSELITSSMKILTKANEKGPEITAKTLIDLSRYLSEIHMGNERMKDLLAESLGSMKSQASFLAPIIAGVVISIISLVTMIMGTLSKATQELSNEVAASQGLAAGFLGDSIPTFLFQSVVGVYITILIIILVYMTTSLENGNDPVFTKYMIGKTLVKSMTKYAIIVTGGIILFTIIGSRVLGSIV